MKHFNRWKKFSAMVQDQGLDVCRVVDSLISAYMEGEKMASIVSPNKVINIHMDNKFLYQVQKPRRTPYSLDCIKPEFRRTFSSILFEYYVLGRARELTESFSFRNFLEIDHASFRRILVRLKRKGRIMSHPIRTNPRFYILAERISDYDTKKFLKKPV